MAGRRLLIRDMTDRADQSIDPTNADVTVVSEDLKLTDEQMAEIERRIEDCHKHPEKLIPWEEVRKRLRQIA